MKTMEPSTGHTSAQLQAFHSLLSLGSAVITERIAGILLCLAVIVSTAMQTVPAWAADELTQRKSKGSFLQPYTPRLVIRSDDSVLPQFCSKHSRERQCPEIVSYYGALPSTTIDDFTAGYKNVRVSMYISSISNTAVKGGGVKPGNGDFVWWDTSSTEADEENGGPYAWSLPAPGETYDDFGPHGGFIGAMVYDALVLDACGSLASFDISHSAELNDGASQIGLFQATDNSTINSTGYYNVDYTVTASDGGGGVSDFRFKGKLNVLCSGMVSLPME